jgi:hypothetical protein
MFDFESVDARDMPAYRELIGETNAALDKKGKIVSVTLPMEGEGWSPSQFAAVSDKIVLMAYDEHWQSGKSGPIASNDWFTRKMTKALQGMPADKVIVALGSYGYDWPKDKPADSLSVEEAWLAAHDSGANPSFDRGSGNTGFSYQEGDVRHDVWMLDAAASWNQMRILSHLGIGSVALWRLGTEDPGFWQALGTWRGGNGTPNLSQITQSSNADVEGQGEILRITATPTNGERQVSYDPKTGLANNVSYSKLPTPYVVQRTGGANPKLLALTFDDGPDPKWTPQILAILEQYKVPGTFFVIGENGVANREILQRMVAAGMELGNHSYTHPNMANSTSTSINLELNATRRLIEAYTGRSIRLFRAPISVTPSRPRPTNWSPPRSRRTMAIRWWACTSIPRTGRRRACSASLTKPSVRSPPPRPTRPPMSSCFTMAAAIAPRPSWPCPRSSPACASAAIPSCRSPRWRG